MQNEKDIEELAKAICPSFDKACANCMEAAEKTIKLGYKKRPQDNNALVPLDSELLAEYLFKTKEIQSTMLQSKTGCQFFADLVCAKFGKDNSGMVANEEFRLDRVEVFGGLAGKGMKHMYTLRPTRYENEQPPKGS